MLTKRLFIPGILDLAYDVNWSWPIEEFRNVFARSRAALLDHGTTDEQRDLCAEGSRAETETKNSELCEEVVLDEDQPSIYTSRSKPGLIWFKDGDKECPAIALTYDFCQDLQKAVLCLRNLADCKDDIDRQDSFTSDLRDRLLAQLRRLESQQVALVQSSASIDDITDVQNKKDGLMNDLADVDDHVNPHRNRFQDLSMQRMALDDRIHEALNCILGGAKLVPPYVEQCEELIAPFDMSSLQALEGDLDTTSQVHVNEMTSAGDAEQEAEMPLDHIFEDMMMCQMHVFEARRQLADQAASLDEEQERINDMILKLEVNGVECPNLGGSLHLEGLTTELFQRRLMTHQLAPMVNQQPEAEDDYQRAKADYEAIRSRLEAAGLDCQAAEDSHDREVLINELYNAVLSEHRTWRQYETYLQTALKSKANAIATGQYKARQNTMLADDPIDGPSDQSDLNKEDPANDTGCELRDANVEEDENSNNDISVQGNTNLDELSQLIDEGVDHWQTHSQVAKADFEAARAKLEEAGFTCPELPTLYQPPKAEDMNQYGQVADDDEDPNNKVNKIRSLPGLSDVPQETQYFNRWRYQLGPFDDDTEATADMDEWEARSVDAEDSLSVRVPDISENTDQMKLEQWRNMAEHWRREIADLQDEVLEGVGALFEIVEE